MAQTSSSATPPALSLDNGPIVGSGLDGQLTWPGCQLPAHPPAAVGRVLEVIGAQQTGWPAWDSGLPH